METLARVGLLVGYVWGAAGIVGYPRVWWVPGAALMVGCLLWLIAHHAIPPEPLVEAGAIVIFLGLMFARGRLFPTKGEEKPKEGGAE
jgi:hypothetical protein